MRKIKRKTEFDKLFVLKDKNLIKVVTGVRRLSFVERIGYFAHRQSV